MKSVTTWITTFAGRKIYRGPKWKDLDTEGKTAALRLCRRNGITSLWQLAVQLEARNEKHQFSRGIISDFLREHPDAIPPHETKIMHAGRRKTAVRRNSAFHGQGFSGKKPRADAKPPPIAPPVVLGTRENPGEIPDLGYCKWPIGDPLDRMHFRYCWAAVEQRNKSYCNAHRSKSIE